MVPCAKIIATSLTSSHTDGKEYEIEPKLNHLGQSVWPIRVLEHACMRNSRVKDEGAPPNPKPGN